MYVVEGDEVDSKVDTDEALKDGYVGSNLLLLFSVIGFCFFNSLFWFSKLVTCFSNLFFQILALLSHFYAFEGFLMIGFIFLQIVNFFISSL